MFDAMMDQHETEMFNYYRHHAEYIEMNLSENPLKNQKWPIDITIIPVGELFLLSEGSVVSINQAFVADREQTILITVKKNTHYITLKRGGLLYMFTINGKNHKRLRLYIQQIIDVIHQCHEAYLKDMS